MKTGLRLLGFFTLFFSLIGMLTLALAGYHENIQSIWLCAMTATVGFAICIISEYSREEEISEQAMKDSLIRIEREHLIEKMRKWDRELEADELMELGNTSGGQ